jgi:ABC-type nickel/cobalt efflux system permease component RcnA
MSRLLAVLAILLLALAAPAVSPAVAAGGEGQVAQIDPSKLIVRPRSAEGEVVVSFTEDPLGWVRAKQQAFYGRMSGALKALRGSDGALAAWTLMGLSFLYGVLHAAGPGHGKAVVSAWLLANERQLRRGILIACLAAVVQAMTAIVIVSAVLLLVERAGSTARAVAGSLESASFGLIALMGLYLFWHALARQPVAAAATAGHHHHRHHHHDHGEECGCGHAHMPEARRLEGEVPLTRALTIAFAVGIRPCTGAILVLLLASAIGLYWAGIASTFAMAAGTAITVSAIAVVAVTSRRLALRLAGADSRWLSRTVTGLQLAAGLFITLLGGVLFWGSLGASSFG